MTQATGIVRLRDVARVELGSRQYDQSCTLDGKPSVAASIYQLPGSNALDTAAGVYAKMKQLKTRFPDGLDYKIVYDTTPFIRESVNEVFKTLRDAVILVGIVVLVFLQDWKAMILPMIDVPVSLIGTFAVMAAMGFSLNNLTLFGLVLAIGIVVDDAIVVLENIERLIATGLDSRTATIKAMEEITGPILAITLVLSSVFIPCCFLGRDHGPVLSPVRGDDRRVDDHLGHQRPDHDAVPGRDDLQDRGRPSRSPAQAGGVAVVDLRRGGRCAERLVRSRLGGQPARLALGIGRGRRGARFRVGCPGSIMAANFAPGAAVGAVLGLIVIRPVNAVLGWLFRGFNRVFDRMTELYGWLVGHVLRISVIVLVAYGGLLGLTYLEFNRAPTGFVPQQDKGYLLLNVQLPDSASVERTQRVMARIEALARETPGVEHTVGVSGQSLLLNANAPNLGSMYIMLKEFSERRGPALTADAIAAELQSRCQGRARSDRVDIRSTADRRPGHDRRLQADHRGSRQSRPGLSAADQRPDRGAGQQDRGASGPVQQLPGQHALALPRDRPDQVHGPGRAGQRALQHAAGLPGLLLRQQL